MGIGDGGGAPPDAAAFPAARYLMVTWSIPVGYGGLTAACLERARLFAEAGAGTGRGGVGVLTFRFDAGLPAIRAELARNGALPAAVSLHNLHENLRDADPAGLPAGDWRVPARAAGQVPRALDSAARGVQLERDADGIPARIELPGPGDRPAQVDHLRPDGSRYLVEWTRRLRGIELPRAAVLDRSGRAVGSFLSTRPLVWWWLDRLTAGEPTVLILDSKYAARTLRGYRRPHVLQACVIHGNHLRAPHRFDSPLAPNRAFLFGGLERFDGMVLLTRRQRDAVAARVGERTNLFVIPNPAPRAPAEPDPARREPATCIAIGSLEPRKRVEHAIRAWAKVVAQVPGARLEIYGEGESRPGLERLIAELGLAASVTLCGYDPRARERLGAAAALVHSARAEGQPLAILEALGRGCPVIAYDIDYGPSDTIRDGVDGFLVPSGDVAALARRIVTLLTDADLAARMSREAYAGAARFGSASVLDTWARTLTTMARQHAAATTLERVTLRLSAAERSGERVSLRGTLRVRGEIPAAARNDVRVAWRGYDAAGDFISTPAQARRLRRSRLEVRGQLDVPVARLAVVGLGVLWNNSYLEVRVPVAAGMPAIGRYRAEPLSQRGPDGRSAVLRRRLTAARP